ncbi:MAG: hypothetical protein J7503_05145 [Cellulomonas iranensis]|uniref:hypothetical protein n=1 Tax=Cellulomonas iranensis TaxID=76862 RepID=UPI001B16C889|nr:hypothetical protein [Cellulomonas iranensis]MBO9568193.1 hypothetical protein [Cellulomonas iranensis]
MTRRPRTVVGARVVVAPVVVAAAVAVLAGACSVRVVDADATPTPTDELAVHAETGADDGGVQPVPAPTRSGDRRGLDGTPAATAGAPRGSGLPPLLERAGLQESVTQTATCGGGDLTVVEVGATVEVTDDCATLSVQSADTRVVAGRVEHLVVEAAGVWAVVADVGTVTVDGAGVRVAWEDGTPRVEASGADVGYGPVGVVRLDGDG